MIDIKKSEFEIENIKIQNGLSHMSGAIVYEILSDEGRNKIENGEKDIIDKDYHVVVIDAKEKQQVVKKKEEIKTDIMRKNKKVVD